MGSAQEWRRAGRGGSGVLKMAAPTIELPVVAPPLPGEPRGEWGGGIHFGGGGNGVAEPWGY